MERVKAAKGERTDKLWGDASPKSRKTFANDASLSTDQAKTVLRIVNVPPLRATVRCGPGMRFRKLRNRTPHRHRTSVFAQ